MKCICFCIFFLCHAETDRLQRCQGRNGLFDRWVCTVILRAFIWPPLAIVWFRSASLAVFFPSFPRSFGEAPANAEVFQYHRHKADLERVSTMCCESNYAGAVLHVLWSDQHGVCRSQWMSQRLSVITVKANQQSVIKSNPMST